MLTQKEVEIALRNKMIPVIPSPMFSTDVKSESERLRQLSLVMSLQVELMNLGYLLSEEAHLEILNKLDSADVVELYNSTIPYLSGMLGVGAYAPFYKNFPEQVMEMSDVELMINAIFHYWTDGNWSPSQTVIARGFAFEQTKFTALKLAPDGFLHAIMNNLLQFPKPLDAQRLDDLVFILKTKKFKIDQVKIASKETLCTLAAEGFNVKLTSPTDVLRIAVKMSGGKIALPKVPPAKNRTSYFVNMDEFKLKKFSRPDRRMLLGMLESLGEVNHSEMQSNLERWKRLGEILHPGEYKKEFPKAFAAFEKLRNQQTEKVRTFAGTVDLAFKKSLDSGLSVLQTRPGEFARRLDSLVRRHGEAVLPKFLEIADKISAKVLFEMYDHFETRLMKVDRAVMLKTGVLKTLPALEPLQPSLVDAIIDTLIKALTKKFSALPDLGKVYIDENLMNVPVPYSMQTSSESLNTYIRGTKVPFGDECTTLRAFCHWFDPYGEVDVDLASSFYDANFNQVGEITYYELKSTQLNSCHSGDVRHRVGSNAEYVDVSIDDCIKNKVRYVVFSVYNYDGRNFKDIQECTFGVMERTHPKSNEIFNPRTVTSAVKMRQNYSNTIPVMFDLEKRQWIWVDLQNNYNGWRANLAADTKLISNIRSLVIANKMSIYNLILLHVQARNGCLVLDPTNADVSFTVDELMTDYTKLSPFIAV